ncbi:hypothetical protein J4G37_32655 [Microvirga sp. 3-52]|nr:hypothetical protein [Microvirga sp. 3-52]
MIFDEAHFDGSGIVKATDLQTRLAHLAPGETLLLPAAEVDEAFHAFPSSEERRDAAVALAVLYRCTLTVCGPDGSQILFTRQNEPSNADCA